MLAEQVNPRPLWWTPKGAFTLPELWKTVDRLRPPGLPMSTAVFVAICFEETGCCNIVQGQFPAAIGPGQLQVSQALCVQFFASPDNGLGVRYDSQHTIKGVRQDNTIYDPTAPAIPGTVRLDKQFILDHNEFSVNMHLQFMQWLHLGKSGGGALGETGLLQMQTGNQADFIDRFRTGGREISQLMQPDPNTRPDWGDKAWKDYFKKRRLEWAMTLNRIKKSAIGFKNFPSYWEYLLPDDFLKSPMTSVYQDGF